MRRRHPNPCQALAYDSALFIMLSRPDPLVDLGSHGWWRWYYFARMSGCR